jgi:hypothetical protein
MHEPPTATGHVAAGRADVVLTALFTALNDPSNSSAKIGIPGAGGSGGNPLGEAQPDRLYDYMRPWYESLHAHPGLNGVVFYDRLPPEFIQRWQSPQVSFEPFKIGEPYASATSGVIQRMLALRDFLARHGGVSRILFTDINDVAFVLDPFRWMERLPFGAPYLFAGEEWTTFRKNNWWNGAAAFFGGDYLSLFSGPFADMYLVNAGVWGGHRDVVMLFLDKFVREVDLLLAAGLNLRTDPGFVADMYVMNLVLYRDLFDRLVTFKLEAHVGKLAFEPGVFFRGAGNPTIHDRAKAINALEALSPDYSPRRN